MVGKSCILPGCRLGWVEVQDLGVGTAPLPHRLHPPPPGIQLPFQLMWAAAAAAAAAGVGRDAGVLRRWGDCVVQHQHIAQQLPRCKQADQVGAKSTSKTSANKQLTMCMGLKAGAWLQAPTCLQRAVLLCAAQDVAGGSGQLVSSGAYGHRGKYTTAWAVQHMGAMQ